MWYNKKMKLKYKIIKNKFLEILHIVLLISFYYTAIIYANSPEVACILVQHPEYYFII